jgi:hypothetical protein
MKIKKQIKRESSRKKSRVIISIVVMVLMSYFVVSLNEEELFTGWERYFTYGYLVVINGLLLINIFRTILSNIFEFNIVDGKIRVKDKLLKPTFSIGLDKIVYVDVGEKGKDDFEVLMVLEKGKRNKNLRQFDKDFVNSNIAFSSSLRHIKDIYPDRNFYCYTIRKMGSYKYYYLYLLYKNSYSAEFSKTSLEYIKRFVEEYNL